ncbi:iron-containing alcohol dehydrogenase [Pectinatus haikarae]|uniref:iron-containing alcohol dehydrogenase n=1 Tax=Pectinatus haikarae TaxID=349096 RepID=UPI0018C6490C|nr:iron-containing alcohol dehydrogenase [Pectinatus haikarae]
MNNFQFVNPVKIIFGKNTLENLPSVIPAGSKVLIIYGGGSIKRSGLLNEIKNTLKNYKLGEFGGIEPNPSYEKLMQAVEIIRSEKYDFLLAAGGGSVIDGTKFIAAAVPFMADDPWKIISEHIPVKKAVPFGTVLTLPATGSEMNNGAVITRKSLKSKLPFMSAAVFPKFSILDPVYTYTLPQKQIANGVVDAFIHVMEQYMTYPVNAKIQDRFSEGLLLTLIEEGPKALQNPQNYDVRANIMWAATLALNGLISSGVPQDWSTHMVGHEITALYGLDHAQTLAIVFPSMLKVMKNEKQQKLLQYGNRIWDIDTNMPVEAQIDKAIQKTQSFFEEMGVKTHFSDYHLDKSVVEKIIDSLISHNMTKLGENGSVNPDIVRKVLNLSL